MQIVRYPNIILNTKSKPVLHFNEDLKDLVEQMILVMRNANGIGLAANQVGLNQRIFIMQINIDKPLYVFINPELHPISDSLINYSEGCLSFPGISQEKSRLQTIKVKWQDINGDVQEEIFQDLAAICIQHENDHINGITFLDELSPLKKQFAIKKMIKNKPN